MSAVTPFRAPPDEDPTERWRCSWSDGRERCHYPGSMSHDVRGSNRWYCRFHFFCEDGATGQQIIEESREHPRGTAVAPRQDTQDGGEAPTHARAKRPQPSATRLPYIEAELVQEEPGSGG